MTRARVYLRSQEAGQLERLDDGKFCFRYKPAYLTSHNPRPISLTLPLRSDPYLAANLFPFFHGLLAEGSTKDLQCRMLKIDPDDAFGRLLKTAHSDTIGAVTVHEIIESTEESPDA